MMDARMPWLEEALATERSAAVLGRHLPLLRGTEFRVHGAELLKRRPGRRAVLAYRIEVPPAKRGTPGAIQRLVGKTRARGLDRRTFRLQEELVARGFGPDSPDGLSVPTPLGTVPEWRMWLQILAPGRPLNEVIPSLAPEEGPALMDRVVQLVHKLHQSGAPSHRHHTVADELKILGERLQPACEARPELRPAIGRILEGCTRLAGALSPRPPLGIHRDFYPAQVVLHGERLHLLDLDLHTRGDPALDLGNFMAHLTEHATRFMGNPGALEHLEAEMARSALLRYMDLTERDLRIWHLLSLARHIGLSVTRAGRAGTTAPLVEHCSRRLSEEGVLPGSASASRPPLSRRASPPSRPTPIRRALLVLLLAATGLVGRPEPGTAQTQHRFNAGLDVSSLYDSNINRDRENPQGLAGVVTTGILRYRMRGEYDIRTEYEVGFHRYAEETPWNRVSHKLRVDGRRPVSARGTLGLVTELQIRGSGEDRSLGNQLSIEPSYRFEPSGRTALRLRGVTRIRRNEAPAEGELNVFGSAEVTQELDSATEVAVKLRYEGNRSDSGHRNFHGPRVGLELTRNLTPVDELRLELEYRERSYTDRMVDTELGEALRRDTRLTPGLRWRREVGSLVRLSLEYEYEMRGSNDPDKVLGGHMVILGAQVLR